MCGFSVYNKNKITAQNAVKRSKKFVQYRGLDDTQVYDLDKNIFIHHRLSIVDHENGSQPLFNENGVLVFNGEIHNYQKLGKEYLNCEFTGDSQFLLSLCGKKDLIYYLRLMGILHLSITTDLQRISWLQGIFMVRSHYTPQRIYFIFLVV